MAKISNPKSSATHRATSSDFWFHSALQIVMRVEWPTLKLQKLMQLHFFVLANFVLAPTNQFSTRSCVNETISNFVWFSRSTKPWLDIRLRKRSRMNSVATSRTASWRFSVVLTTKLSSFLISWWNQWRELVSHQTEIAQFKWNFLIWHIWFSGTNDRQLIRLVVTRCEIDMVEIKEAFERLFNESLRDCIKGDTSGDYKHALYVLIGEKKS